MKNKVVKLYQKDAAKNIDLVLEQAIGHYEDAIIIGYLKKNGELQVRANTGFHTDEIIAAMEMFKHKLLSGDYGEI